MNMPCAQGQIIDIADYFQSPQTSIQNETALLAPPQPWTQQSLNGDKVQLFEAGFFDASKVGPLPINIVVILLSIIALVLTRQRD
jgi:hypothetical protein